MKYSCEYVKEIDTVQIVIEELNSCCEAKELIDDVSRNHRFSSGSKFYIDIRGINYTPIIQELCDLSQYISSLDDYFHGHAAFIVSNEVHHYLFKYGAVLLTDKGLKSRIFCEPEPALLLLKDLNVYR